MRKASSRAGVTLVELLVVFAILALLFALSLPAVRSVWRQAKEMDTMNEMQQIVVAYCNYASEHGHGPNAVIDFSSFYENSNRINKDIGKGRITVIWGIPGTLLGSDTVVAYETHTDRLGNRLVAMGDGSVQIK